jgi:hypothetical protein
LQDHYAGATTGLALARRCRRANPGLISVLADLEDQIADDRDALRTIMSKLGVRPSRVKAGLGAVVEVVGRLKGNGRIVRRSPLSLVVELELLHAGVITKRNLWRALLAASEWLNGLDDVELKRLAERANAQAERIVNLHFEASGRAFAPVDTPPPRPAVDAVT